MKCRLCNKRPQEIGGYLHRVNETGVAGIWECRPSCDVKMGEDEKVLAAIEGPGDDIIHFQGKGQQAQEP